MKSSITKILLALLVIFTYTCCTKEKTKFIFYKDSDSGEISSVEEYNSKIEKQKIIFKPQNGVTFTTSITDSLITNDTLIYIFKNNIKIDQKQLKIKDAEIKNKMVKSRKKIDLSQLKTIDNKALVTDQNKPTLIYVWKTNAKNCIKDFKIIESLLNKKYTVFALTHETSKTVANYLSSNSFEVNQIVNAPYFLSELNIKKTRQLIVLNKNKELIDIIDISLLDKNDIENELNTKLKNLFN